MEDRPVKGIELWLVGVAALVLVVAALVGGDGGKDHPKSKKGPSAGAATTAVDVRRIIRRVEHLRSLRFRRRLEVTFASPAKAGKLLTSEARPRYASGRAKVDEEELKLIGLLSPSTNLEKTLRTAEREEVLGFYDERSKRLVVIRGQKASRPLLEVTLAHELDHALDDQHFGLRTSKALNDDASVAADALFEGTATAVMAEYAGRYLRLNDLLDVLGNLSGTQAKLPKFIEDSLLFPYDAGEEFVTAIKERGWRQAGRRIRGWQAVNQVFRRRPRSTEQVLHPEKYVSGERGARLRIPPLRARLGTEWRRLDVTSVGEFDLRELFSVVGREPSGRPAAGWNGGKFELWRRNVASITSCPAPCIDRDVAVMRLAWDRKRDRLEGEAALQRVFERGLRGRLISRTRGVGLWSSRGGAILMAGGSNQTDVVFAPKPGLGAALLLGLVR